MHFENNIYKFSIFPLTVIQGISTRYFGVIKKRKDVFVENFKKFLQKLEIDYADTVVAGLVHGKEVAIINDTSIRRIEGVDGLITQKKNIFLWIGTADCLPIVFYDKKQEIVGIAHAGYKGILAGIIEEMIEKFVELGSDANDLQIGVGPGIGSCCYNVPKERIDQFIEQFGNEGFYQERNGEYFLDLDAVVRLILRKNNILKENIEISDLCTKDHQDKFYSHRGTNQTIHDDFVTIVGMK